MDPSLKNIDGQNMRLLHCKIILSKMNYLMDLVKVFVMCSALNAGIPLAAFKIQNVDLNFCLKVSFYKLQVKLRKNFWEEIYFLFVFTFFI